MQQALIAFASSRLALIITGYLCLTFFPAHPVESWQGLSFPGNNWIDGWVRWDSFWYESIVDPHPRFIPEYLSNANFFPFYSWVSWLVALPLRAFLDLEHAFFIGALIVSSASFAAGAHRCRSTRRRGWSARMCRSRTVWLIAVFPFSFFFTAVYADALYFCLCAWSLLFASEKRWYAACALAAMASMTRIPGVALLPALGLEYLRQNDFGVWVRRGQAIACIAILAVGPIVIGSYYEWRYDNPLEFLRPAGRLESGVGDCGLRARLELLFRSADLSLQRRQRLPQGVCADARAVGRVVPGAAAGIDPLALTSVRTLGIGLAAWALISIALSLPNGFDGVGRFTAVLFPVFVSLAVLLRNRAVFVTVCIASLPFLLLFFAQFARWRQVL